MSCAVVPLDMFQVAGVPGESSLFGLPAAPLCCRRDIKWTVLVDWKEVFCVTVLVRLAEVVCSRDELAGPSCRCKVPDQEGSSETTWMIPASLRDQEASARSVRLVPAAANAVFLSFLQQLHLVVGFLSCCG